jgi:hypothetical protein
MSERLTRDEATKYLAEVRGRSLSKKTLGNLSTCGRGPKNENGWYLPEDLDKWDDYVFAGSCNSGVEPEMPELPNDDRVNWLAVAPEGAESEYRVDQLEAYGCRVAGPVSDPARAIKMAARARIDAAIIDMTENVEAGIAVADVLADRNIPFILEHDFDLELPASVYDAAALHGFSVDLMGKAMPSVASRMDLTPDVYPRWVLNYPEPFRDVLHKYGWSEFGDPAAPYLNQELMRLARGSQNRYHVKKYVDCMYQHISDFLPEVPAPDEAPFPLNAPPDALMTEVQLVRYLEEKWGIFIGQTTARSYREAGRGPRCADVFGHRYRKSDVDRWVQYRFNGGLGDTAQAPALNPEGSIRWLVVGPQGPDYEAVAEQLVAYGAAVVGPLHNAREALKAAATEELGAAVINMDGNPEVGIALANILSARDIPFETRTSIREVPRSLFEGTITRRPTIESIKRRFPESITSRMDFSAPLVSWFDPEHEWC